MPPSIDLLNYGLMAAMLGSANLGPFLGIRMARLRVGLLFGSLFVSIASL